MRSIKIITLFTAAVLVLAGCIKQKGVMFTTQSSPSPNTVDFPNQGEVAALEISNTPTIYTFYVELNSANKSYPGTSVTIAKNPSIVAAQGFEFLPDSTYQLVNTTATVDPITHLAAFQLKVFTNKINLSHVYAVGYSIASATGGAVIATNKNTVVIQVGAKNKYDGVYNLTLRLDNWQAYGISDHISGVYPGGTGMVTAGVSSVSFANYLRGGDALQPAFTGGTGVITGNTAFGATTPMFTFDPNTNALISVVNTTPDDGRGRTLFLNPAITTSRYDPATKTIYAAYIMTQNGRPNQLIFDTLRYVSPRP